MSRGVAGARLPATGRPVARIAEDRRIAPDRSTMWRGFTKMRRGSPLTGLHGKNVIPKKEWASRSKIAMMAMPGKTTPARKR